MKAELVHQNPGASQPLRILLEVECNTPDAQIIANVRHNSSTRKGWQKLEPAHDGIAILCGSGPSLADTLDEVKSIGGEIFALNGAAKFLNDHGVLADYQVILDAKPETASLIGPAKKHLFASQVDPSCFEKIPDAKLWHATHGDLVHEFPAYDADYCLIGGAVTVGNAALVLAYVMGYRVIHCFGFDSSHKGKEGHAFSQPMNDDDPLTIVTYKDKQYVASLTMKLQVDHFLQRAAALKTEGCSIHVHGYGLLPDRFNNPPTEEEKYREMWNQRIYRDTSPGENVADTFVDFLWIDASHTVIDFGCGTGRGGKRIQELTDASVRLVDFADNCLDPGIDLPFTIADLSKPIGMKADFGFCCDVMEHIPPSQVLDVLRNILACTPKAFFQISLVPDVMGSLIGEPLHLSVHPHEWWMEQIGRAHV